MVAYEIAPQMTWADAMGLVVIEGVLIAILVLTGLRESIFRAVPTQLKAAIGVGIGLFLTIIGLVDAGFVRRIPDTAGTTVPVGLGINGRLVSWPALVFVFALLLTIILFVRKVRGAILIGILAATVLALIVEAIGKIGPSFVDGKPNPTRLVAQRAEAAGHRSSTCPTCRCWASSTCSTRGRRPAGWSSLMFVFTLLITDFFDTMGTMVAVGQEGGLLDENGMPPRTREILLVDSVAAAAGGAASVSSNTSYIESASGVAEGARTGVANLVTGGLFLLAMFIAPLVTVVPFEAASAALVIVGFLMMTAVRNIDWTDYEIGVPAFLTIVLMPFTYSISIGIGAGIISYAVIKLACGKGRQVHPLLYAVAALFVVYFLRGPIETLIS